MLPAEFHGQRGNDVLRGGGGVDDLFGDGGNDVLHGNGGDDGLRGGNGDDELHGGSNRDRLFGNSGSDDLNGGSGDDGLFGGVDSAVDELNGGTGDDRFLVFNNVQQLWWMSTLDEVEDKGNDDAQIGFEDGEELTTSFNGFSGSTEYAAGQWNDGQVETVDQVLSTLQRQTDNTRLLKTSSGGEITMVKQGRVNSGNEVNGWNGGSRITITQDGFDNGTDRVMQTIFHEVGHNWDNENPDWNGFQEISGWRNFFWPWQSTDGYAKATSQTADWWYEDGATFARTYGRTNPQEDSATSFALFFMNELGKPYSGGNAATAAANVSNKMAFLDDFFADLA